MSTDPGPIIDVPLMRDCMKVKYPATLCLNASQDSGDPSEMLIIQW